MKNKRILPTCLGLALLALIAFVQQACALEVERISQNAVWDVSGSPYRVQGDLAIAAGGLLTIKPGVRILMEKGASLVIEGEIMAMGTADEPIVFTSASENPAPGDWGSLRFVTADTTLSYDENGAFVKGSRLEYCVIEYGGMPAKGTHKEFLGGAIHCRKSSPYLRNLTLRRNRSLYGGGIYCHEFASPYIEDCRFLENEAKETGGGLACFFYSNAVVKHSIFQANTAGEHGGGIYFSFSSPQILENIIENNQAKFLGGGLCGSNTVTGSVSRIRNNVLLSNQSGQEANNVFVTAKMETIFQENCLISASGYDVFIDNLEADLDFRGNYFGPLAAGDLEARIKDRYDDPSQKAVLCDPVLEAPPTQTPNAPTDISAFELHGDAEYATDWLFPLCDKAPIYLEVRATDRNPYHADWVAIRLRSSESDARGVVALAWETGPSSGIFRLQGGVEHYSSPKEGAIKAAAGETLFFSLEGIESEEISRHVDVPKSYLTAFHLLDEADSLHLVNHQPKVAWEFRNIFGRPQTGFRLQLSEGRPFSSPPIWESGQQEASTSSAVLNANLPNPESLKSLAAGILNPMLQDGCTYSLRLSVNSGAEWSDWMEMTLRMNSLPSVPQLVSPLGDQVVNQIRPSLKLQASSDAEHDPILYEVQLYQDAAFTRVLAIEKELHAAGQTAAWTPSIDLKDDAEYFWRARSRDAFEIGAWTSAGHFYVNLVEEPPLPFALLDPEPGLQVYELQPVFSWNKTLDPDPLSNVHYRLLICPDDRFAAANSIKLETDLTFLKVDRPLKNDANYFWKVEAVDNTGRPTTSDQIGRFSVSTTPTVPQLLGPLADVELRPEGQIAWTQSSDPDPEDSVHYRLQIVEESPPTPLNKGGGRSPGGSNADFSQPLLDELLTATDVKLTSLKNYSLLSDNKEYRLRVRAEDNQGIASNWSKEIGQFFFNQINTPPGAVALPISPDGVTVSEEAGAQRAAPLLSWGAAADADKSDPPTTLSYMIQFDQENAFRSEARQVQVMAGVTQIAIPALADNAKWFYRICARDDEGAISAWSPIKSFVLNLRNDPPEPFTLQSPADGLTTYKLTGIELTWNAASDLDPEDKVHYLVHLAPTTEGSSTSGGLNLLDGKRTDVASFKITIPLQNETEYLWWAEAEDIAGARTPSTGKFHLKINTTPFIPQVAQVPGGIVTGKESLHWQASADPDPTDVLTYGLQIVSPAAPQKSLLEVPKINAAKSSTGVAAADLKGLKQLPDNQTYAFQVRAVDQHGAASAWSEAAIFALDLQNEPPSAPALLEPVGGLARATRTAVRWSASSDPDPGDKPESIAYRLQAARGENFNAQKTLEHIIAGGSLALPDIELGDNQLWSLRLRAEDGRGGVSAWSSPAKLVINTVEDSPSAPQIRTPLNGSQLIAPGPVQLAWAPAQDPDYNSSVSYELRCWPTDEPEKALSQSSLRDVSFLLTGLQPNRTYQWQVSAVDNTGLRSTSESAIFTYRSAELPPAAPGGLR